MSKNVVSNPFVSALKSQMEARFMGLQIEVNPRSAWVKGEIPVAVQQILKDAGFMVCKKGFYFTHECVKMPAFPQTVKPVQVQKMEPAKTQKTFAELSADVKAHVLNVFTEKYPNCNVQLRGSWIYISGEATREYKDALKEDGFHWGFKIQAWSRALTPEELTVKGQPEAIQAPAVEPKENVNPVPNVSRTPEQIEELTELRKIVIQASKGLLTHDEMIGRMKEVCPF